MLWILLPGALAGVAVPAPLMETRLAEIRPLRPQRLARDAPQLAGDTWTRAAAGEVVTGLQEVEGHRAKKVWAVAVVDVPVGRFWAAINDIGHKVAYTPLDYAEVVEGSPCRAPRREFQFLPIPIVTDRWWVVDVRYNDTLQRSSGGRLREQVWRTNGETTPPTPTAAVWAEKGMPIVSSQGSWFLVDLDGRHTLVEYYTWADPGGSIPPGLASSLAVSNVDETIAAMTKLAKDGPGCPVE